MEPATLFYSYSHKDSSLRSELHNHLAPLREQGLLSTWFDGEILPGAPWGSEIAEQLDRVDIVLFLVSSDFFGSESCGIELKRTMQRHASGRVIVIPIILRPCDWKLSYFGHLQALPTNGKAVTQWDRPDEAWLTVAQGIRQILEVRHMRPRDSEDGLREKWIIRIDAEFQDLDHQSLSAILDVLRKTVGDLKLNIERVTPGSVKIEIDISASGARTLRTLVESGTLTNLAGFGILGVTRMPEEDLLHSMEKSLKKKRVLVVDDDDDWLHTTEMILSTHYDLSLTTDPSEAVSLVESSNYPLAILDQRLGGGVSGLDLFKQLCEIREGLRAIILTGYADLGDAANSMRMGVFDYISKGAPDLEHQLRTRVAEAIEGN